MATLHGLNYRAEVLLKKGERLTKELHETNLAIIQNREKAVFITSNKTEEGRRVRKEAILVAIQAGEAQRAYDLLLQYRNEAGASKRFQASLLQFFLENQ